MTESYPDPETAEQPQVMTAVPPPFLTFLRQLRTVSSLVKQRIHSLFLDTVVSLRLITLNGVRVDSTATFKCQIMLKLCYAKI